MNSRQSKAEPPTPEQAAPELGPAARRVWVYPRRKHLCIKCKQPGKASDQCSHAWPRVHGALPTRGAPGLGDCPTSASNGSDTSLKAPTPMHALALSRGEPILGLADVETKPVLSGMTWVASWKLRAKSRPSLSTARPSHSDENLLHICGQTCSARMSCGRSDGGPAALARLPRTETPQAHEGRPAVHGHPPTEPCLLCPRLNDTFVHTTETSTSASDTTQRCSRLARE